MDINYYWARGRELMRDLQYTTRREVPIFNRRAMLLLIGHLGKLYAKNTKDASLMNVETSRELVPLIKFRHACMERLMRFMLAYLYVRLAKLRRARWYYGATLPDFINDNVTEQEAQYFFNYSRLLSNYMRSLGDEGLDLTSTWRPVRTYMMQVYVLKDWEILMDDGDVIKLVAGSIQMLPRAHFEHLYKLGVICIHKPKIPRRFTRF